MSIFIDANKPLNSDIDPFYANNFMLPHEYSWRIAANG
jgi:hypothetical protein